MDKSDNESVHKKQSDWLKEEMEVSGVVLSVGIIKA